MPFRLLLVTSLALAAAVLLPVAAAAAEARDYAFLRVQGKLIEPDGEPVTGARVELAGRGGPFETTTDGRGFFVFERLPLGTYELEVRTARGELIQRIKRFDTAGLDVTLVEVAVGRGEGELLEPIVVAGAESGVEIKVPEPTARMRRLWVELLVFGGAAAVLLAL